jgi:hypothetical protein
MQMICLAGFIQEKCSATFPGWMYFLYGLHHLLPTSLFLVPLSLTCDKLLADEKRDQKILEEKNNALAQEQRLLEAMVPKGVVERLRSGQK